MPDEKADFWDAVAYVGGLPDPRAKLVASQATLIGDMREALKSMDEEVAVLRERTARQEANMLTAATAFDAAVEAMRAALIVDPSATLMRAHGAHANIMAYVHGDPDYMTESGLSTYHTDLRPERKGRKAKAAA